MEQTKEQKLGTMPLPRLMASLAIPSVIAQLINVLYNIIDRMYIGHIPKVGPIALTGVGLTFPIIMLISAFSAFIGAGGAPLASIALGKGDKERRVYFDAKAKLHLQNYIKSRTDDNPALFVTLDAPYDRLKISGVEIRMRELGRMLKIPKIHPHKFRRTMATRAIDKGMPIEQVQKILGHSQIDTTMQYAIVNQNNVKASHRRYIA